VSWCLGLNAPPPPPPPAPAEAGLEVDAEDGYAEDEYEEVDEEVE
jgi:hypothetical protein